ATDGRLATFAARRFIAPDLNLFARTVCLAGMTALLSSWDSQRWRTVGLMTGWYVLATICEIIGRVADGWQWLRYASFLTAYAPEAMVARPDEAWSVLAYQDGSVIGLGLGAVHSCFWQSDCPAKPSFSTAANCRRRFRFGGQSVLLLTGQGRAGGLPRMSSSASPRCGN